MLVKHQAGFTLVELMVAMAIGTLIILGAGQLFLTTFQTFEKVRELSQKQEVVVFFNQFVAKELRKGGTHERYELSCLIERAKCRCTIHDTRNEDGTPKSQREPIIDFYKDFEKGYAISDEECSEDQEPLATEADQEHQYEVRIPILKGGEHISFNVTSRKEILDQYFDNGDNGDNGDVTNPSLTPDPDREGYYMDGTKIYNEECYKGNGDLHNKTDKHKGCNVP